MISNTPAMIRHPQAMIRNLRILTGTIEIITMELKGHPREMITIIRATLPRGMIIRTIMG